MKAILRKFMPLLAVVLTLGLASCDSEDWRLEDEIVGSWCYYYEDWAMFEEERYIFSPDKKWAYTYLYEDNRGNLKCDVDGGTYDIMFGRLKLNSDIYNSYYEYDIDINNDKLIMRSGGNSFQFYRYR